MMVVVLIWKVFDELEVLETIEGKRWFLPAPAIGRAGANELGQELVDSGGNNGS